MKTELSWGNLFHGSQSAEALSWRTGAFPTSTGELFLPRGMGKSYGDSCINQGGTLLSTERLNRFISFDEATGRLCCEAGVSLSEIIRIFLPRGFFVPITLGTKLISVGGAIANDVHGKNHHRVGTWGRHTQRFEILRSNGDRIICSDQENPDLFRATIGGLGLTGVILWAEIELMRVPGPSVEADIRTFRNLNEYLELAEASHSRFDHSSAWIDFTSGEDTFGRGVFFQGNFIHRSVARKTHREPIEIPTLAPNTLLNPLFMKVFNWLYFNQRESRATQIIDPDTFFFPLDRIGRWNRLYGKRGFFQYQCVFPSKGVKQALDLLAKHLKRASVRPYLSVLKSFGSLASPGWLSFPMEGVTVSMDFPNLGSPTRELMDQMDQLVSEFGGRVYPAKDARMSPKHFEMFFPKWREFQKHVDPKFSSNFWRRVTQNAA